MSSYLSDLDLSALPRHVAIVMDGNGRWAKQRGLPRTEGHCAGEEALYDVVDGAIGMGLEWLTVFAFSTENWKRPAQEVRFLMNYNRTWILEQRDQLNAKGVRILFIGRRSERRLPRMVDRCAALALEKNEHLPTAWPLPQLEVPVAEIAAWRRRFQIASNSRPASKSLLS